MRKGEGWVVRIAEGTWLAADKAKHTTWKTDALSAAERNGCNYAVIQAVPPEFFATEGRDRPYVVWNERVGAVDCIASVRLYATLHLNKSRHLLDVTDDATVRKRTDQMLKGTEYKVFDADGFLYREGVAQ